MAVDQEAFERGVMNMLSGCAGARRGDTLLIVREERGAAYYSPGLPDAVAAVAERAGLRVTLMEEPFSAAADSLPPALESRVKASDHTLFLARLGDQLRFRALPEGTRAIVSYALDEQSLASGFGTAPHDAFVTLKSAFNAMLFSARSIRVTCPLGTDFAGASPRAGDAGPADVTIQRFPMCVFAPIDAGGFTGRVAVAHLLVGTGSRYYAPYGIPISTTLFAVIDRGRLLRGEGDPAAVARAEAHYGDVAGRFGLDGGVVHSWHAGIHPGCAFTGSAHDQYERWSGSAFGNPRLLHFHTCGDYAPGEICWNIVDPTIAADGVIVWDNGRILIDNVPGAREVLDKHAGLRDLFERPELAIGLGDGV
ncbi:MAG: hypothetical protein ACRCTI_09795 [Beijerinckiaceae bacterium]